MHKRENIKRKKHRKEEKVENIYGVHFDYDDLFSRLLKVQKQRKLSEGKSPIPRMSSFDSGNLRQFSTGKRKKEASLTKKSTSNTNLLQKSNKRSASVKKIIMKHPVTDRKHEIFKSYSPSQKKPKKLAGHSKNPKTLEKKASCTVKIPKKTLQRAREI